MADILTTNSGDFVSAGHFHQPFFIHSFFTRLDGARRELLLANMYLNIKFLIKFVLFPLVSFLSN